MKRIVQVALIVNFTLGCLPGVRQPPEPHAILTFQKKAYRLKILLTDLEIKTSIAPPDATPYSDNASAGIWVGKNFPFELAIESIRLARNYYSELRYIALSDMQNDPPSNVHYQLYLGGSTATALELGLSAWSAEDFAALGKVKSQEEFHELIRKKRNRN